MNQIELERAAEDRLFDAALAEVLASTPARSIAATTPRWFAAAIMLLGTGVLLAIALLAPRPDPAAAQQPQQALLPPPIRVEGKAALAAVDRTAQNLWCVLQPGDLPLLAEFPQLRRLLLEEQLNPIGIFLRGKSAWSLTPLARCTHLQSLGIGNLYVFTPAALAAVAALPDLRAFELIGTNHLVDTAFVDQLQKLPLHSLSLQAAGIDASGFTALCRLPLLEQLELRECLHLDRCDLSQLQQLRQLRRLALRGVGGGLADSLSKSHPLADEPNTEPPQDPRGVMNSALQMPGTNRLLLTAQIMQRLASLPQLRTLDLRGSVLDDDTLAALPPRLEALDLRDVVAFGRRGLAATPPLPHLRSLGCSQVRSVYAEALDINRKPEPEDTHRGLLSLLRDHRVRSLQFEGKWDEQVEAAIAQQTALRELELTPQGPRPRLDLGFTSAMPELERLAIVNVPDFDPTPLTKLEHLRRVELRRATADTVAKVRRALGNRVQVIVTDD